MKITMRNGRALQKALADMSPELEAEVITVLKKTGINLRNQIVKNYQRGPASGRVYEKTNPRRTHRASAPGEAPMSDTGRLANSVVFDMPTSTSVSVFTMVEYGYWLEFGTIGGADSPRILPRPNWVPTVEEYRAQYIKDMEAAIKKVMG